MAGTTTSAVRWFGRYGRATFRSRDTYVGLGSLVAVAALLVLNDGARETAPSVLGATVGVCAGLLGIVLAAMAVVTAFITRTFVATVGSLDDVLMPFATVATVAGAGLTLSLGAMLIGTSGPAWLTVALVSCSVALTVWAASGVVQLVWLTVFFARVREKEMTTLIAAEQARERRLREAR